jgi:capsular exopolysaccharide synthesis family protein
MKALDALGKEWALTTEVRKLESRIWNLAKKDDLKVIMISSALQGEGKSTTLALLAAATALHRSRKILAIDLDFRSPRLHAQFEVEPRGDFIEYLKGDADLDGVIEESGVSNLDLILANHYEGTPDLLLNSERLKEAFETLRSRYDLIFLDVPALVPVADASAVIPFSDAVLLVIMAGRSTKTHVARARELCQGMDANLIGLVVGNIQEAAPGYMDASVYELSPPSSLPSGETPLSPE